MTTRYGEWFLHGIGADGEFHPEVQRIHDKYVDAIRAVMYRMMWEEHGDTAWNLMHYQVGHIVWDDGNVDDHSIDFSLQWTTDHPPDAPAVAVWLAKRSLRELKRLPPEKRMFWSRSMDVSTGPGCWSCGSDVRPYSANPPED